MVRGYSVLQIQFLLLFFFCFFFFLFFFFLFFQENIHCGNSLEASQKRASKEYL